MFSRNVIPLPQLTEQEKLRYLKNFYQIIISKKQLLSFRQQQISLRDRISRKKANSIISKGDTDHSLNSLCHKQPIQKVTTTKYFVIPETLPLNNSASKYHSFQTHFQIKHQKEESNLRALEWSWAVKSNKFIPVQTDLEAATQYIPKIIR